ncbi:hypothetical protein DL89DRAFT_265472 [Linderina pennispora]|uniref:Retrotransposon gag domain-containing protein n=1 Tax=Linderina pennispora TaxID=61395 RepID=A0A1Y1WIU7_9FUNG|nr:uncharacterized protein DL89DRAFT_265472 [Linderina pennispora]ORX73402.1 hypothetical protein DL89DRAFT_265472 [Linderina pennispora]
MEPSHPTEDKMEVAQPASREELHEYSRKLAIDAKALEGPRTQTVQAYQQAEHELQPKAQLERLTACGQATHTALCPPHSIMESANTDKPSIVPWDPHIRHPTEENKRDFRIPLFLYKFQKILYANGLQPDHHWTRLLPICLEIEEDLWLRTHVSCDLSWKQARQAILDHLADEKAMRKYCKELFSCRQEAGESAAQFACRFRSIALKAGGKDKDTLLINRLLDLLPESISYILLARGHQGVRGNTLINIVQQLRAMDIADKPTPTSSALLKKSPRRRSRNGDNGRQCQNL